MTSPNRTTSLEDVLDALFLQDDAPTSEMIVQACLSHAEYRDEIMEFAALRAAQAALPEPPESLLEVTDVSVMRLQSRVMDLLYTAPSTREDVAAVRAALNSLAGHRLRSASRAMGLGDATQLLNKILTRVIVDPPRAVLDALANFLSVGVTSLSEQLGPQLALHRSYKSSDTPSVVEQETWVQAIQALAVDETEKVRLRSLQDRSEHA